MDILLNILGPILLMVFLGAVLRWKFSIDLGTLSKLNIYLFSPAFVFYRVSTSKLDWDEMGAIVGISVLQVLVLGVMVFGIGKALRVNQKTLAAIALAVMFYNSGNYGLPLAELAFPKEGGAVQAFVMMTQSVMTFTVGLMIAAWAGSGGLGRGMVTVFRLPILPALAAAVLVRYWTGGDVAKIPTIINATARYIADGLIPVALITLGAQLASNPRWPRWKPVSLTLVLRLIYAPIQMAATLWVLHYFAVPVFDELWPWPASLLILTASVPTGVNTLLLTLELNGDADLAADTVFWTTVFSALTITGWLAVIKYGFGIG